MDTEKYFNPITGITEEFSTVDGITYIKTISPTGEVSISAKSAYDTSHWTLRPDPSAGETKVWRHPGLSMHDYDELARQYLDEEERKVKVDKKKSHNLGEHIICCSNPEDLSADKILKTLSAVKGRLMIDIAPIHIKSVECIMTPTVRKNITLASKKLKMYGKKMPIIARFDELGNRLPDEIEIGSMSGITLKIVDPDDYGEYYFELKGIEFPQLEYRPEPEYTFIDRPIRPEDIPF